MELPTYSFLNLSITIHFSNYFLRNSRPTFINITTVTILEAMQLLSLRQQYRLSLEEFPLWLFTRAFPITGGITLDLFPLESILASQSWEVPNWHAITSLWDMWKCLLEWQYWRNWFSIWVTFWIRATDCQFITILKAFISPLTTPSKHKEGCAFASKG